MSKKLINSLKKLDKQPALRESNDHSLDSLCYLLSYMYDDSADDDFGTFDFDEMLDLLDSKDLDRFDMDYDFLNRNADKTFENESKINSKPEFCFHEMEKKFLLTSHYLKCKKCGHES